MKVLLVAVGFVGAGLMGAVAGQILFPAAPHARRDPGDLARLEAKFDDLREEVARLEESVRTAKAAAPLPDSPARDPAIAAVPAGDAPAVAPAPSSEAASPSVLALPDEVIEDKVRETVAEIAREQREERARQIEAKQTEKEAAWLESIREDVGLTDYQVEELAKLMKERRAFVARNKRKYAELGSDITKQQRETLQMEAQDYGRELDLELRKVLDAGQYEAVMNKARAANKRR